MSYTPPVIELLNDDENGLKRGILCPQFLNRKQNSLTFALGADENGEAVCPDLARLPHLLICGAAGSGKSTIINSAIISMLYAYSPEELKFVLIDGKYAESPAYSGFNAFANIPHLYEKPIFDAKTAIDALNRLVTEMERRYTLFKELCDRGEYVRNIAEYNEIARNKLPRIVAVIDEFSELCRCDKKERRELESGIIRLAQKSRACGIHIIMTTRTASAVYMPTIVISSFSARLCLKAASRNDSLKLLSDGCVESLKNSGEGYYRTAMQDNSTRLKTFYISREEVLKVCAALSENGETGKDKVSVIICAAGKGERAGFDKNKLLAPLSGAPALYHTLKKFAFDKIDEVIVTSSGHDFKEISALCKPFGYKCVLGGKTRTESVKNALEHVTGEIVLIHDGARPYVSRELIIKCIDSVKKFGSGVCAIKLTDSVAWASLGLITERLNRDEIYRLQTPQGFLTRDIKFAYELSKDREYTDDSSVYGDYIAPPRLVDGEESNIKLTFKRDFEEGLPPLNICGKVGFGVDVHAFCEGDGVTLGGIKIPCGKSLIAHSDGDVLVHALMDALLSAGGLRDIGCYFPDTDEKFAGADSCVMLEKVVSMLREKSFAPANVSVTIQAETPRLAPHIEAMREKLCKILGIDKNDLAISAGTCEKLGFVGEGLGITAYCAVTLKEL